MKNYNKGFSYFKNTFHYLKDSFAEKGFIITFSGVDGAGKSTVISEVSELIEKRYRRPVKVLRHRPSLLPILSVWTKGKEKAHEDAVNSLPRQETTKTPFLPY
jgi:predicted AAA+ superfamily ATPase